MVEKLNLYLNELEAKRVEVANEDNTAIINAEIAEATDAILKRHAEEQAVRLAKIDSDIECVKSIIARESINAPADGPTE